MAEKGVEEQVLAMERLRGMRTRAKKKYVASDRARRKNVPRQILPYVRENFFIIQKYKRTNVRK